MSDNLLALKIIIVGSFEQTLDLHDTLSTQQTPCYNILHPVVDSSQNIIY